MSNLCRRLRRTAPLLALGLLGCSDRIPEFSKSSTEAGLVHIRHDLIARPLPDIPWPNDELCWIGAGTEVPCRPNLSTEETTGPIRAWLDDLDAIDGWPLTPSILVSFDRDEQTPAGPALDLARFQALQTDADLANDPIYLVDLDDERSIAVVPGTWEHREVLQKAVALDPSDPRGSEPSLALETVDERFDPITGTFDPERTLDGTSFGATRYRPEWDSDADGIIDVPLMKTHKVCPQAVDPLEFPDTALARDRCLADGLVDFYFPSTDTLAVHPSRPLAEGHRYVAIITDRLVDSSGYPVGSPFDGAYYPTQRQSMLALAGYLGGAGRQRDFGNLANGDLEHVAFAWTFTTSRPIASLQSRYAAWKIPVVDQPAAKERVLTSRSARLAFEQVHSLSACSEGNAAEAIADLLRSAEPKGASLPEDLAETLSSLSHIVTGTLSVPAWLEPRSSGSGVRLRQALPDDAAELVEVPFWLSLPEVRSSHGSPVVIAVHDGTDNRLSWLATAGQMARQGLAMIALDRPGARAVTASEDPQSLQDEFSRACSTDLLSALMSRRSDASTTQMPPGGESGYDVISSRDLWRSAALEDAALADVLSEASTGSVVDFDDDGIPDISIDDVAILGLGTGGSVASLAAALTSQIATLAIIDPASSPPLGWLRGATFGSPPEARLEIFGPRLAGVPVKSLDGAETRCDQSSSSIRWYGLGLAAGGEEVGCLSLPTASSQGSSAGGATVVLTDLDTSRRRCVGVTRDGRFSMALALERGDPVQVTVWDSPGAVVRYGSDADCDPILGPEHRLGTEGSADHALALDPALLAPATGLGIERQSRKLLSTTTLAEAVFAPANPAPFVASLALAEPPGSQRGVLIVVSSGDTIIPPEHGVALARAAALVPFMPAEYGQANPDMVAEVAPTSLAQAIGAATAADALAYANFEEAAPRLQRHSPDPGQCGLNRIIEDELPAVCQASCTGDSSCGPGSSCVDIECQPDPPSSIECAETLMDVDAFDSGASGWGALRLQPPLRLVRKSGALSSDNLEAAWSPRKMAFAAEGPYVPNQDPLAALALPLDAPRGSHGIVSDSVCQAFRPGRFLVNLVGRFLATRGLDYPPVTQPNALSCLETDYPIEACGFFEVP